MKEHPVKTNIIDTTSRSLSFVRKYWMGLRIPGRNGQSLPEFAITITFILMILLGIFDIGRVLFTWITLRDAAQEAAAYGSSFFLDESHKFDPATRCTEAIKRADDITTGSALGVPMTSHLNASCNIVNIYSSDPQKRACAGNPIQITTIYRNYPISTPFLGSILGTQSITITARINDTILAPECP